MGWAFTNSYSRPASVQAIKMYIATVRPTPEVAEKMPTPKTCLTSGESSVQANAGP
jgi:hypothetical protein